MPRLLSLLTLALLLAALPAQAQDAPAEIALTAEEAVQLALVHNYDIALAELDVATADAQVREAWGQVLPQIDASASYTRNVMTANPFAGSDANSLFGGLGAIDWLVYNEGVRNDGDPSTEPISLVEFQQRQAQGLEAAGISTGGGGNPFGVPNQFSSGITVSQTLYNASAFAAVRGAQALRAINAEGAERQRQLVAEQVRNAFYAALLAQRQADVSAQSVERAVSTFDEIARRVEVGTAPKFDRLGAEVELANRQTALVQTRNAADNARDNLLLLIGLPVATDVRLRGDLDFERAESELLNVSLQNAVAVALERRDDVQQAELAIELREVDRNITRAQYRPTLSAFANVNYTGSVPDDRTSTLSDPDDPFAFESQDYGFFADPYWDPSVNVGLRMNWNLFSGFQTSAQVQQRQIAMEAAQVQLEQLVNAVQLEVETARRNLAAAQERIATTRQTVEQAELNYQYASRRLEEGVASPIVQREASAQLDQSQLNYLQAVYDYLVARNAYRTALGVGTEPVPVPSDLRFTEALHD